METVFGYLSRDVESPVCAVNLRVNGIRVSFFSQITIREQLPATLGIDIDMLAS
ncbi:hypothetical protein SPACI_013350 [Sporomusa acidovorans DSM 3132]|uniref:Uncharacterized protein n=1 Tax=Sporomusa acidovorans (strain ATCC 49682 / DSM 3132 / Mol) TaxID=1123286 RepID=A0ABZ3IZT5_SPOA4|nr:hypothetical protein SPACI_34490 [Sporomusa acidovorans DSM 3132]SDF20966.1 hypothetical protein SAMN04488499_103761 [Sporomusa acidovorans]